MAKAQPGRQVPRSPVPEDWQMTSAANSYSTALLPCPCCGGKARFQVVEGDAYHDANVGGHYIDCEGCGLSTNLVFPLKDDVSRELAKRELAEKWNKQIGR